MRVLATVVAVLASLTACVVEDRVIIRDPPPRPLYYGHAHPHYWRPAPSYWHAPPYRHRHYWGYGPRYRPYRW